MIITEIQMTEINYSYLLWISHVVFRTEWKTRLFCGTATRSTSTSTETQLGRRAPSFPTARAS